MTRALFRFLLRAYPASFRAEYGPEMTWTFDQQLERASTRRARLALLARMAVDVLLTAPKERVASRGAAMQPAGGGMEMLADPPFRSSREMRISALAPLWLGMPLQAILPGSLEMLFTKPPDILGIPAALVFDVFALGWMAIGAAIVWHARYRLSVAVAITVFAVPATLLVTLSPSVFRLMMYLG